MVLVVFKIVSLLSLKVPSVPQWLDGPWGFVVTFYLTTLVLRRSFCPVVLVDFRTFCRGFCWVTSQDCSCPLLSLGFQESLIIPCHSCGFQGLVITCYLATSVIRGCPFTIVVFGSFSMCSFLSCQQCHEFLLYILIMTIEVVSYFSMYLTIAGLFFHLVVTIQGLFFYTRSNYRVSFVSIVSLNLCSTCFWSLLASYFSLFDSFFVDCGSLVSIRLIVVLSLLRWMAIRSYFYHLL